MPKGIAVITGVGLAEAHFIFRGPNPATLIEAYGTRFKMNAAAGTAVVARQNNWLPCLIGHSSQHLEILTKYMTASETDCHVRKADLLRREDADAVANEVMRLKKATGMTVHLVHYGTASNRTKMMLKDGTVFGGPWDIPPEVFPLTVADACQTLMNFLQAFKRAGLFDHQEATRLIIISAITATRTKLEHGLDAAQKWALHGLARSLALDLTPEKIYVTEVMPGMTDGGLYDNPASFHSIQRAARAMGYEYAEHADLPMFSAEEIGTAVLNVLNSNAHYREVSLMPRGQYPQLGA